LAAVTASSQSGTTSGPPHRIEVIKAITGLQLAENRDLVRTVTKPAKSLETAQHPLGTLAAIVACSHLRQRCDSSRAREPGGGDGDQFIAGQLPVATEDDLKLVGTVPQAHLGQPDEVPLWMRSNTTDLAHDG